MNPKTESLDRFSISKMISDIEDRIPKSLRALAPYFQKNSFRKTVCITGPAGVGKSTLISYLSREYLRQKESLTSKKAANLAWLACDPSSPVSGGSLLGDRIRLSGQGISENLYIRSLSTRGTSPFSQSIRDIEVYLERFFDQIWVETAGSGQTQTEVARISATTVLVLQPETGDEIQWMKSGVREWADLFIVHKSDMPGADSMARSLQEMGAPKDRIFMISSTKRSGAAAFLEGLSDFQKKMDWKKQSSLLHTEHARALALEKNMIKFEKEFARKLKTKLKSPYR